MSEATLYIDGRWTAPRRGHRFCSCDPATGERLAELSGADARDVDLAVKAARNALERDWGRMRGGERAGYLEALANNLELRQKELAVLEARDNGKPLPEAECDVADAIACFRYYASVARAMDECDGQPPAPGAFAHHFGIRHEPVGVAGQIMPWSYPLLMAAWKVAPALAAGATCVLVPSEFTPLSALELGVAASCVGLPPGVLNILPGFELQAGMALARHPGLDRVDFTGNPPTQGKGTLTAAVALNGMRQPLRGKSVCIVFDDVDVEAAVEWILFSSFRNQGQIRSATSRLLVHQDIAPRLVECLVHAVRGLRIGPGLDAGVQLGPLVSPGQCRRVMEAIDQGLKVAQVLTGGKRFPYSPTENFVEPTLFDEPDIHSSIWRESVLGPVLCVKRFRTEAEALDLAEGGGNGSVAWVMSADQGRAERVANGLRAGVLWSDGSQSVFIGERWNSMEHGAAGLELSGWELESCLGIGQATRHRRDQRWAAA
ncbi:aldehyde dehydrogenase family protein [Pseudomonas sp. LFM046]|uniref:aldehyde dehydrogenase family protein n=1 Tax=Pseudomonas sp. LFM046 TaxID=1608357 RepID=UPI0005CFC9A8|nr:aldehyde dehydrogenase family protein [Pseudomonas sp. LFM046]